VIRVPLLALDAYAWAPARPVEGVRVRMLDADDPTLAESQGAVELAFAAEGLDAGDAGPRERDLATARLGDLTFLRDRLRRGLTRIAVAEREGHGVLAAGSHQLAGHVTEVAGVGTIPSARRRGIGAAVTGRLVEDARALGAEVVFLSAADDDVARMYERLGFRRIGTACFGRAPAS
jgi:N-acetylglutamate synthase-like GNAT family acetyltransferase